MKRTANSNMQSPIFRPSRLMISTAVAVLLLSACTGANQFKKPRYAQDKRSLDAVACSAKAESLINRDIGGETTLGNVIVKHLEPDAVCYDGGLAYRDIGKGTGMDHTRLVLYRAAQRGIDGVAHPGGHGTTHFQVAGGNRVTFLIEGYGDVIHPFPQVG